MIAQRIIDRPQAEIMADRKRKRTELLDRLRRGERMGEITFTEYQAAAERTANSQTVSTDEQRFANFGMGLSGEAGEVTDLLKKVVFHGHTLDAAELETELGDVLWYVAALANTAGLSLAGIAEKNVAKLRTRYPEGFDVIRSIKREVGAK